MDFSFTEEQLAVAEAAAAVFDGRADAERVAEVEATAARFDTDLWAALAGADLLGLAAPTADGGAGLGLTELCLVLEAQGRRVAPVPYWATAVLGVRPLARHAPEALRHRLLPAVVRGEAVLTAGLSSTAAGTGPAVRAERAGDGWRLSGTEPAVPWAHVASTVLLPATAEEGVVLVALDLEADGVTRERAETTNREVHPHLHLDGVAVGPGDVVAGPGDGAAVLDDLLLGAWTGLCALSLGVGESALTQTAAYLNQRHQFGRPLASFQGALLRAGESAIDLEAVRVTLWQAAWRLDTGRPAAEAVAVAKWQAAERGQKVVHATQHLHGGIGADISYPIHRYFLWNKQLELLLGGPSAQLARLGRCLAERYRAETGAA
jgi:alkylation response protein AidB-like acyl-CoA dehydrogenase